MPSWTPSRCITCTPPPAPVCCLPDHLATCTLLDMLAPRLAPRSRHSHPRRPPARHRARTSLARFRAPFSAPPSSRGSPGCQEAHAPHPLPFQSSPSHLHRPPVPPHDLHAELINSGLPSACSSHHQPPLSLLKLLDHFPPPIAPSPTPI